jgi:enterochelin esterase-like enzyme
MRKRQETQPTPRKKTFWSLALFLLLLFQACSPHTISLETSTLSTETATPVSALPSPLEPPKPTQISNPTSTPDCLVNGGELRSSSIYSESLEADLPFYIYLPPCYQSAADQHYPVVYLLHGLLQTPEQWLRLGLAERMDALIAEKEIPPFIIILPLEATFNPPQTSLYPNAIIDELIPWVDDHYHTRPQKAYRAVGGASRGAAWAVRMGFKYHNTFGKVGAHSLPLFEADSAHLLKWVTQIPVEDLPVFFIDIGWDDQEWKSAQDFANLLDDHSIPHEWYLFTGGHTEDYWSSHLEQYLRWYSNDW